jgi:hypothetical protein
MIGGKTKETRGHSTFFISRMSPLFFRLLGSRHGWRISPRERPLGRESKWGDRRYCRLKRSKSSHSRSDAPPRTVSVCDSTPPLDAFESRRKRSRSEAVPKRYRLFCLTPDSGGMTTNATSGEPERVSRRHAKDTSSSCLVPSPRLCGERARVRGFLRSCQNRSTTEYRCASLLRDETRSSIPAAILGSRLCDS